MTPKEEAEKLVKKHGIILMKTSLVFENEGVLNPAAIREGDFVHLFYRAVSNGNYSSIGYCKLMGPLEVEDRMNKPLIFPEFDYELHGIEDPRIVKIEDLKDNMDITRLKAITENDFERLSKYLKAYKILTSETVS